MSAPEPSVAASARAIVRAADRAALATAMKRDEHPYASLVMTACGQDASPLILVSELAEHTTNLLADGRAALLYDGTAGLENPLTGPRVTVQGRFAPCAEAAPLARYLARHPDAGDYVGFADFGLWRMTVERVHIVAGFGAIHWIEAADFVFDDAAALVEAEADIVEHMNADHADALALYATRLAGHAPGDWRMTGIDPEGCDLRCGGAVARIAFETAVRDSAAARIALATLARRARDGAGESA